MATTPAKRLQQIMSRRVKAVEKISNDTAFMGKIADDMADQIRERTRTQKGVTKSGKAVRLKALKSSTKEQRRRYKNRLNARTTPKTSNLTATGQMLDAIFGTYRRNRFIIDIKRNRSRELVPGQRPGNNKKIAGYVEEQGRRFFDLADFELEIFLRRIRERIRKML